MKTDEATEILYYKYLLCHTAWIRRQSRKAFFLLLFSVIRGRSACWLREETDHPALRSDLHAALCSCWHLCFIYHPLGKWADKNHESPSDLLEQKSERLMWVLVGSHRYIWEERGQKQMILQLWMEKNTTFTDEVHVIFLGGFLAAVCMYDDGSRHNLTIVFRS